MYKPMINSVSNFFKYNKHLISISLIVFILGFYPIIAYSPTDLLIKINSYNNYWLDIFFSIITHLGTIYAYSVLMLFFINRQIKVIIAALFSFFNVSVIVLITKRLIGSSRPIFMPEIEKSLHFVNGITHECDMSFPSGHASTIFTMVCIVCLLKPTKGFLFHFCLIITAILVAYSRVYLCHHFYKDIYFGAILGTVITITTFCLFTCCCKDSFYK